MDDNKVVVDTDNDVVTLSKAQLQEIIDKTTETVTKKADETIVKLGQDLQEKYNADLVKALNKTNPFAQKDYVNQFDPKFDKSDLAKMLLATFETRSKEKGFRGIETASEREMFAKGDNKDLQDTFEKMFPESQNLKKELSVSIGSEGGLLVPEALAPTVLPYINEVPSFFNDIPSINMPNGGMTYIKEMSQPQVRFVGELQNKYATTMSFGDVKLNSREAYCQIVISNKLLRTNTVTNVEQFIQSAIMRKFIPELEYQMLKGSGNDNYWLGMYGIASAAGTIDNSAGATIANIRKDFASGAESLESNTGNIVNGLAIMSTRSKNFLSQITNSVTETAEFRADIQAGSLFGFKLRPTNVVKNTYLNSIADTGTYSELYLVDASRLIKGITRNMSVRIVPYGTYHDESGVIQSGESKDTTTIYVQMEMDFAALYPKAVAVKEDLNWVF
jgi:HK97 family phage major capsid protein